MNKETAKRARRFAYFCFGVAIVNFAIYLSKSLLETDSDPSEALLITAIALLIAGSIGLAGAKKASQE